MTKETTRSKEDKRANLRANLHESSKRSESSEKPETVGPAERLKEADFKVEETDPKVEEADTNIKEKDEASSNRLNLGGIVPLSTVDWPGTATMVIFMRGCPLRCPHCFNDHLQTGESFEDFDFVKEEIKKAAPFISGIVFSGGEALMQPGAVRYIAGFARKLGLKVGLESCGYYPERLEDLLEEGLFDQIFLDVKAALSDPEYASATGRFGVAAKVAKSLEICVESGSPFEVRVTVFPEMTECVEKIGKALLHMGVSSVAFQQGVPKEGEEPFEPVSKEALEAFAESFRALGISAKVRMRGELD